MSEKLKPCPHCGGVVVTEEHATFENPSQNRCAIVCEGCGAYGGPALGSNVDLVAEKATELWNKRPDIRRETIEACEVAMRSNLPQTGGIHVSEAIGVIRALDEAVPS